MGLEHIFHLFGGGCGEHMLFPSLIALAASAGLARTWLLNKVAAIRSRFTTTPESTWGATDIPKYTGRQPNPNVPKSPPVTPSGPDLDFTKVVSVNLRVPDDWTIEQVLNMLARAASAEMEDGGGYDDADEADTRHLLELIMDENVQHKAQSEGS